MPWLRKNKWSEDLTDQQLLGLYKNGTDMEPIGILFNRYLDLAYGVCLKYLKSPQDSEDAVMQIFELISVKLKSHNVQNFKSWLHVVVKNYCFEVLRKSKKKLTIVQDEFVMHSQAFLHHDSEFEFELGLKKDYLSDCMSKLPTKQNQAVNMFYLQGKSYKEISDLTGQSTDKIRSSLQNGRRNLKICMEKKNGTKSK